MFPRPLRQWLPAGGAPPHGMLSPRVSSLWYGLTLVRQLSQSPSQANEVRLALETICAHPTPAEALRPDDLDTQKGKAAEAHPSYGVASPQVVHEPAVRTPASPQAVVQATRHLFCTSAASRFCFAGPPNRTARLRSLLSFGRGTHMPILHHMLREDHITRVPCTLSRFVHRGGQGRFIALLGL